MKSALCLLVVSVFSFGSANSNVIAKSDTESSLYSTRTLGYIKDINTSTNNILSRYFIDTWKIDNPEDIIVTVGTLAEATGVDVPMNAALLSTDWLARQPRPTIVNWVRMPLYELVKVRAFGSSAPANRMFLAGAHRAGQPEFPIPLGGYKTVLQDKEGNAIPKHSGWPDIDLLRRAIHGSTEINFEKNALVDFSKLRWSQRYGIPSGGWLGFQQIKWHSIGGYVDQERRQALNGKRRTVEDRSDFKVWHQDSPTILFNQQAKDAVWRYLKGQQLDTAEWAYILTDFIRSEATQQVTQDINQALRKSIALAIRSNPNSNSGELSEKEALSLIKALDQHNKDVQVYIPYIPAKGINNIPRLISKNHSLIADERSKVYVWHFLKGPKQGFRGGFKSKGAAIDWYKNWVINEGGRSSPTDRGEVFACYDIGYEQHLMLDVPAWYSNKDNGFDFKPTRIEKIQHLKLVASGYASYGRMLTDQLFKSKYSDILEFRLSTLKQRRKN